MVWTALLHLVVGVNVCALLGLTARDALTSAAAQCVARASVWAIIGSLPLLAVAVVSQLVMG
ncbi:MAG: hypothetical protein K6V97_11375 [Actinomycetia bacterium]|nr:hypothetical protein [Actinomycetes bacterium]